MRPAGEGRQTEERKQANRFDAPISVYEVHLGSWRRHTDNNFWLSYRELADQLVAVCQMDGLHPHRAAAGQRAPVRRQLGLSAARAVCADPPLRHAATTSARSLTAAHAAGLNVILDWVPGHFPSDAYGLAKFDGTALYEHADPREGYHQDWNTLIYNYGRREVRKLPGRATRCTGWSASASTRCASMRWRR